MKKIVTSILLGVYALFAQAQMTDLDGLFLGIRIGANNSPNIPNLSSTIIPSSYDAGTYNIEEYGRSTFLNGGLYIGYQFPDEWQDVAIQTNLDIIFSQHQGGYHYDERDFSNLEYDIAFKYLYSSLFISPKLNYRGIFAKLGIGAGVNLSPENISYSHSPEDTYGISEYVEEELKLYLKGKPYFGYSLGFGYEFMPNDDGNLALGIEFSYNRSFGDILEARANPYEWSSRPDNRLESWELTVYFAFLVNN